MSRPPMQTIAEYRSEVGRVRVLRCVKRRACWKCKFSGFGLGRNSGPFFVQTAAGLPLLAALRVDQWGGSWTLLPGASFPPIPREDFSA